MENSHKKEIRLLAAASVMLAATFFIFGPLQLYIGNITELWFSITDVIGISLVAGVIAGVLLFGAGLLFKGKSSAYYICIIFGAGLALYIQGNFTMTDYGLLDGKQIDWGSYTSTAIWNTGLWLVCLALPFVMRKLTPPRWENMVFIASLGIIAAQAITLGVLGVTTDLSGGKEEDESYIFTNQGQFELSEKDNTLIFILDRYDSQVFSEFLEQNEELKTEYFSDFVYYPDTVGGSSPTDIAMPHILTGKPYITEEMFGEYLSEAYAADPLYQRLKEENYDTAIYTLSTFASPALRGLVSNMSSGVKEVASYPKLAYYLYKFTAFRYFPHVLKECVWMYSGDFDAAADNSGDQSAYLIDDALFYRRLLEEGISVQDDKNTYRLYHLYGAHEPYTLDSTSQRPGGATSLEEQELGVMNILWNFFSQMEELGIYENANIIIMADHGDLGVEQNPIFLVKRGAETEEFTVNDTPVSYDNLTSTLLEFIGGNDTGVKSVFELNASDNAVRKFYLMRAAQGYAEEYVVNGPAGDMENVSATGARYALFSDSGGEQGEYSLGERLYFDLRQSGNKYATSGLQKNNELEYTWSKGEKTEFSIRLKDEPKNDLFLEFELALRVTDVQRVNVYVNDTLLNCYQVAENRLAVLIPKDAVRDGQLNIRLGYLDAVSPSALSGSTDTRVLSLAFYSMVLREAKDTDVETGTVDLNEYTLGETIRFTPENDGGRFFSKGIWPAEAGGWAWTVGKSGRFSLYVGTVENDLTGEFTFEMVYAPPQKLVVRCGDQVLYDAEVTSDEGPVLFAIPAECIEDGWLELDLEYPDAVSPESLGEREDSRELAFMFTAMRFYEAG